MIGKCAYFIPRKSYREHENSFCFGVGGEYRALYLSNVFEMKIIYARLEEKGSD